MCRLDCVCDWIERGREAHYSGAELAILCGISQSQLRRFFLEKFLRPPQEWLNELRLWDAAEMLAKGKIVKEVAHFLFFADASHFSHSFQRYFRCAPTSFTSVLRERQRKSKFASDEQPWISAQFRLVSPLHLRCV